MATSPDSLQRERSGPDMGKLSAMTNRVLTVTKIVSRTGSGEQVFPTQKGLSVDDILGLQKTLPGQFGPGTYKFEVYDEGGPDRDQWSFRHGAQLTEVPMASVPSAIPPVGGVALDPDVRQIVPGFYYNDTIGVLRTPWGEVVQWRPGQAWPAQPSTAPAPNTFTFPPPSPLNGGWGSGFPGWGSIPAVDNAAERRAQEAEARLAEERRRRELEEVRASTAKLVEESQRRNDEQMRRLEAILERVTARPTGPSEDLQAARRETEELRRRLDEQAREDRWRAEMRSQQEKMDLVLRELTTNKADPMLSAFAQMLSSSQTASTEIVRALQASAQAGAQTSEAHMRVLAERLGSSVMSPIQMMELVRMSGDKGGDFNETMMKALGGFVEMQQGFVANMLDMAGKGEQPAWVSAVNSGLERVGQVAQAVMANAEARTAQAQAAQTAQYTPPQQRRPRPANGVPAGAIPVTVAATGPTTAADLRDAAAQQVFGAAGKAVPVVPPVAAAPAVGPAPPAAAQAPATTTAAPGVAKRRRRAAGPPAAQASAPAVPDAVVAPGTTLPTNARAYPVEAVRAAVAAWSDIEVFGMLLPYVQNLRSEVQKNALTPAQVAEYIMSSRAYAQGMGAKVPAAIELLETGHTVVLLERLLPEALLAFRAAVVVVLDAQLVEQGGDEGDEGEDGEDEGDEP